jgi:MFS family permease
LPEEVKIVLFMAFNVNTAYWQIAPFFPKFVRTKNIDKIWVGIAMSSYAFLFLVSSLFTGKFLLYRVKRIDGCFIGAALVITNLVGFGLLDFVDDPYTIVALSLLFQMIGGIGNGINNSSAMALLSSFKEQRDEFIGYFEVCAGLGAIFGPLIGSILYALFDYAGPFFGLGLIQTMLILYFHRRK